eukprot:tig00020903_g15073.t1
MTARAGERADTATHGGEAVEAVRGRAERGEPPYAMIFMDMEMPVMDGFQASRKIRQLEAEGATKGPPSKIVALTANAMEASRERCREAGMDDFLAKPVKMDQIARMVERFCRSAPTASTSAESSASAKEPRQEPP